MARDRAKKRKKKEKELMDIDNSVETEGEEGWIEQKEGMGK